ncbi:uncharacterized protein LOC118646144 [Monomorium pharaonis]|uniref:uncharacterized protein LOC118646144 n=1 Tax=Monomorium pharaonis TaxID=307658 RepID=UPI0017465BDF|nr:uncharacterized protein LOC118646144 [Monomorium pharaonis]
MTENTIKRKGIYKYCFVPGCLSTTIKNPCKIFVCVPKGKMRKKWIIQVRRDPNKTSLIAPFYCCEDHFDLQQDLENYMRVKLDQNAAILLKKGVLPRFFDCQTDRKRVSSSTPVRSAVKKLRQQRILQELNKEEIDKRSVSQESQNNSTNIDFPTIEFNNLILNDTLNLKETESTVKHKGIQVSRRPLYRSVHTYCNIMPTSTTREVKDAACSPIKSNKLQDNLKSSTSTSITASTTKDLNDTLEDCDEYLTYSDEISEEALKQSKKDIQEQTLTMRKSHILNKPKVYIGMQNNALFILKLLADEADIKLDDIYLTLEKIKLNHSFIILSDKYGKSPSNANTIFRKTIPILAHYLKKFIFWPSQKSIKASLPLPFRARYNNVQSIIDCFEIEIQKPSNPLYQALTWSEYKKCNTIKYLISATLDGTINFISESFGGKTTDATIVEKSQYLNVLPPNCKIMADRGFKHIECLLQKKGCTLIRPSSVSSNTNLTKSEVIETRRIASLRIYIERVIGRLRDFEFLTPHAGIPYQTLDIIDEIVLIVAALINLQTPIIAQ